MSLGEARRGNQGDDTAVKPKVSAQGGWWRALWDRC